MVLLLLFSWPPVRGVFLNYEVVVFQPRTVTPTYLGCYSTLLNPLRPSLPSAWFTSGGGWPHPPLATLPSTSDVDPHRIICPPGCHLYQSQYPETHRSLTHPLTPLRPCLLRPCHACRISDAAPLPPPKSWFLAPPSPLGTCISVIDIQYWTQRHPPRHCCLPPFNWRYVLRYANNVCCWMVEIILWCDIWESDLGRKQLDCVNILNVTGWW